MMFKSFAILRTEILKRLGVKQIEKPHYEKSICCNSADLGYFFRCPSSGADGLDRKGLAFLQAGEHKLVCQPEPRCETARLLVLDGGKHQPCGYHGGSGGHGQSWDRRRGYFQYRRARGTRQRGPFDSGVAGADGPCHARSQAARDRDQPEQLDGGMVVERRSVDHAGAGDAVPHMERDRSQRSAVGSGRSSSPAAATGPSGVLSGCCSAGLPDA